MLKKLFNNKIFIFIFAFVIEAIYFYYFEHLFIGGDYIIPDIGLGPIFALMFGPIGALGHTCSMFIFEITTEGNLIAAIIDFGITFLVSIATYKLWYAAFKGKSITTPKFDSTYNLLKFIVILGIVSTIYWAFINISLEAYPPFKILYPLTGKVNIVSYFLDMFNFSVIFGLLFISLFNILKIPMQTPRKKISKININYKYFRIMYIPLLIYPIITLTTHFDNDFVDNALFIIAIITIILFYLNNLDINIENKKNENYSIIEQIILLFLIILVIVIFDNFNSFTTLTENITMKLSLDLNFIYMIGIAVGSGLILILSLIHINHVEKKVTNPIYDLIDALNEYKTNKELKENTDTYQKLKGYLENNDDISRLVKSFIKLENTIANNLFKIKKTTKEKERIETEFNVASNIQTNMLKTDFNEFSKDKPFEISAFMKPAKEVGGDFYDFFNIDDEHIGFVIGDVSGKGIPATLFMVKTMYLIRNHSKFYKDPKEVYENVNNLSCQRNNEELFVTSWFGKLNLKTGHLTFVNAGHDQPLIKDKNNTFEYLDIHPNFVLGGMEGITYKAQELNLNPGDTIFLYTDGIIEANSNYKEFFGEDRLKETINKYKNESLNEILEKIKNEVYAFCNDDAQFDDMTMLIIRYNGCENNENQ